MLKSLCVLCCLVYVLWNESVLYEAYVIRSTSKCNPHKTKRLLKVEAVKGNGTIWKRRSSLEGAQLTVSYVDERPYCFEVAQGRQVLIDNYVVQIDGKRMAGITIQVELMI